MSARNKWRGGGAHMDTGRTTNSQAKNPTLDHRNNHALVRVILSPWPMGPSRRHLLGGLGPGFLVLVCSTLRCIASLEHGAGSWGRGARPPPYAGLRSWFTGITSGKTHDESVQLQWRWGGVCTRSPTAEILRFAIAVPPFHATGRPQCPQWEGSSGSRVSGTRRPSGRRVAARAPKTHLRSATHVAE